MSYMKNEAIKEHNWMPDIEVKCVNDLCMRLFSYELYRFTCPHCLPGDFEKAMQERLIGSSFTRLLFKARARHTIKHSLEGWGPLVRFGERLACKESTAGLIWLHEQFWADRPSPRACRPAPSSSVGKTGLEGVSVESIIREATR